VRRREDAVPTLQEVIAQLTGPGGAMEIAVEDVLGVPTQVYRQRMHSMRELMAQNELRSGVTFCVQGDRRYTYGEHDRTARAVAAGLTDLGIGHGDRVAIVSANTHEWLFVFWACAILGAVCVPLNAWQKGEELQFALDDCGAKVVVVDRKRLDVLEPVLGELPAVQHVFLAGEEPGPADGPGGANVRPFSSLIGDGSDPGMPGGPIDEDDVFAILYTSGTTGRPKGATLTHRQVIANLANIIVLGLAQAMAGVTSAPRVPANGTHDAAGDGDGAAPVQDASLLVVPLFHVTGCLATMVVNYATGGKLVLMPAGRFDPDRAMQIIQDEKVTSIGGVPTIMWRIIDSPNFTKYDLSSVKRASYGGAPSAPELVERIEQAFPNLRKTLSTAYGLTESASVATALGGDDYFSRPSSCGQPVPTVELEIRDDQGREVPRGESGEIWLKGPTMMLRGYWNRPEVNREVLVDGWFRTGDIARQDDDNFVYIVDRAKDMIIRAGENIYCVEIENVLYEVDGIDDAAVIGVPHTVLGEEVKAVVHVRPGATVTEEQLREHCRAHLADFKVPAYFEFRTDPLPRNPAGKILKAALRGGDTAFVGSDDQAL
jgi:long-chain acyl-CoA synthetase